MTTPRILVIDDEVQNLKIILETLSDDYSIVTAEDGIKGLEILSNDTDFQAIVLDWMMPHMDGIECLRRIKLNPNLKDIPVIFHTARVQVEDKIKGLESGIFYYLEKPGNPRLLKAAIKNALEEFHRVKGEKQWKEGAQKGLAGMVKKAASIANEIETHKSTTLELFNYKHFFEFYENSSNGKPREVVDIALNFIKLLGFKDWEPLKTSILVKSKDTIIAKSGDEMTPLSTLEQKILEKALMENYIEGEKESKENNRFVAWGVHSKVNVNEAGASILVRNFPDSTMFEYIDTATMIQEMMLAVLARLHESVKLDLLASV